MKKLDEIKNILAAHRDTLLKDKDILQNIDSIKSVLDGYRPFPNHVVKHLRDYYRFISFIR